MKGHHARRAHRRMRWLLTLGLGALVGPAVAGTTQPERTWLVSGAELITLLQGKGADGFCDGEHCRGCPAPGPAATYWALPMPAAGSGVGRAGSFRMNWSIRCLPISGSCPAGDCGRMRLPWLSKRCVRRSPVIAPPRLVAVPSPAKQDETPVQPGILHHAAHPARAFCTPATRCIHGCRHPRTPHCAFLPRHGVQHGHL